MNKKIAIFCGSTLGIDESYKLLSIQAAATLANNNYDLVYGGGYRGLMGQIAETFKNYGCEVIGVLPKLFDVPSVKLKEVHTQLIITEDMHSRKEKMFDLADSFVIFPGGIGTFEEFFEIYTWKQLGLHTKNIVLYNLNSFYNTLIKFLDEATEKGFMSSAIRSSLLVANTPDELLSALKTEEAELPSKI